MYTSWLYSTLHDSFVHAQFTTCLVFKRVFWLELNRGEHLGTASSMSSNMGLTGGDLVDSMDFHESTPLTPSSSASVSGNKPKVCSLLANICNKPFANLLTLA